MINLKMALGDRPNNLRRLTSHLALLDVLVFPPYYEWDEVLVVSINQSFGAITAIDKNGNQSTMEIRHLGRDVYIKNCDKDIWRKGFYKYLETMRSTFSWIQIQELTKLYSTPNHKIVWTMS